MRALENRIHDPKRGIYRHQTGLLCKNLQSWVWRLWFITWTLQFLVIFRKGSKAGRFMGTQTGRGHSGEDGRSPKTRPHVPSLVVSPMLEEHLFLMRSPRQVTASTLDLRSFVSAAVFPR